MAELREWSAQALRYQGSDGPVKVMYFGSRLEVVNNDSFDQHDARRKNRPELDEQISFKASRASDTRAVFSGHLFDDLVELKDLRHGITHTDVRLDHLCALIFGITTKFNPSGMWIVEDFFYDEEEVE